MRTTQRMLGLLAALTLLASTAGAQVRTWTGLGGNNLWTNELNWSENDVPDTEGEDAVIDGDAEQDVSVTLTIASGASFNNGALTVGAGDSVTIAKVSAPGGAVYTNHGAVANSGVLTFGGSGTATSHGHSFVAQLLGGAGGTFNSDGGAFYAKSLTSYRRNSVLVQLPANNTNDGDVYVQNVSAQGSGKVRLSLVGAGHSVFVNNGAVHVEGRGSDTAAAGNQPWAVFGPGSASAYLTLSGDGTLHIQSNLSAQPDSFAQLSGLASGTTLTNSATHSIVGNGYIGYNGTDGASGNTMTAYKFSTFVNHGLVRAARSLNWSSLLIQPVGGNVVNSPTGRMIASGDAGTLLRIGSNPANAGTFTNDGRLEARSGCSVWLATNLVAVLDGETRGGGTFIGSPAITLAATVLMPGDSENDDGTGTSTVGTLAVDGDLVFGSTSTLSVQLGVAGTAGADYDTVAVTGSLTLDGTVDVAAVGDYGGGGQYQILSFAPGTLTDNGLVVGSVPAGSPTPRVVVDNDAGAVYLEVAPRATLITVR